jgi:uncharacterized protein YebE (UPF0316 family)
VHTFIIDHPDLYNWLILPLLIFLSRIGDVSLSTLRNIFLHKGFKKMVPIIGFFEVLLWIIVVSQVMKNLNNWLCYFAWAGGFALGTVVGMAIEEKLALGLKVVRVFVTDNGTELITALRDRRQGVTIIDGHGALGPVKMIYTVVNRKLVPEIESLIIKYYPNTFYSVEDIKEVHKGTFTPNSRSVFKQLFSFRQRK